MASDSEPRKFFSRPPRGPLRSHISGSKKPIRLLMSNDSAGVEVGQCQQRQLQNYIVHRAQYSSSFSDGTCREGFLPQCVDDEATQWRRQTRGVGCVRTPCHEDA